mgnify:CR=1 FL=1
MIKNRIRKIRKEKGVLQTELAERMYMSVAGLGYLESGRNHLSPERAMDAANALNVPACYLTGYTDDPGKLTADIIELVRGAVNGKYELDDALIDIKFAIEEFAEVNDVE